MTAFVCVCVSMVFALENMLAEHTHTIYGPVYACCVYIYLCVQRTTPPIFLCFFFSSVSMFPAKRVEKTPHWKSKPTKPFILVLGKVAAF